MGTVIKKTSMPFKNVTDFNTSKNKIQIKYEGDDVVFTGYLNKFYDLPFEKVSPGVYGTWSDYLYLMKNIKI